MTRCSNCGTELHSVGQFCTACGKRTPYATYQPQLGWAARHIGLVILLVLACCMVVIGFAVSRVKPTDDADPPRTEPANLRLAAPCAAEELVEAEILQALEHHDDAAVKGLYDRNEATTLEAGTAVDRLIEDGTLTNVRVEAGYSTGKYCWVPNAALP